MPIRNSALILFLLTENVSQSLLAGRIGHMKEVGDVPKNGELFLIADSYKRVLLGPFRATSEQFYSESPMVFHRRLTGTKQTEERDCHYLFDFEPIPEVAEASRGLLWNAVAHYAGLPTDWWRNIRKQHLNQEQFDALCKALLAVNHIDEDEPAGTVSYASLSMSDELWEDYLKEYYVDRSEWGPDGEPLNHAAEVYLFFGGEGAIAESNCQEY